MTAVGLKQHGSGAVGHGFGSLLCQILLRFRIVTPPPSTPLIHKIFRYQEFSEAQKDSPTKFFWYCQTTNFRWKIVTLPPSFLLIHIFFRCQKFSQTQKGSPTKFFGTVRQKIFYRKS